MRTRKVTFTHKGWFGLCPVYLADINGDAPDVHERHWIFRPLFCLSVHIYEFCFALEVHRRTIDGADLEWPLTITGELAQPFTLELPKGEPL